MECSPIVAQLVVPAGLEEVEAGSLYAALHGVTDGRAQRGRRYEAALVVTLLLLAKLAGEQSLSGIAQWVRLRAAWIRAHLPLKRSSLPCANTYRYVCEHLDGAELNCVLAAGFLPAAEEPHATPPVAAEQHGARQLAVDGKSLRGSDRQGELAQAAQQGVGL
jgi:hypothetical protein